MNSLSVTLAQNFFTAILIMFVCGTVVSKVAQKFSVPDVVFFILAGIIIGPLVSGIVNVSENSTLNQVILLFGASFILFHGGLITSLSILKNLWRSITLLSTSGMVITTLIVGIGSHYILGMPFLISLLLGALLASTDPASLIPIFQQFPIREKVAHAVITESAFTDATGAILVTLMLGFITTKTQTSVAAVGFQFCQLALGGILIGALVGLISAFLISENQRSLLREYAAMVIVICVLASYVIAEWIHASGFMSVFTAGLIVGNAKLFKLNILSNEEHAMNQFVDAISLKLRMLIFILLGTHINFTDLKEYGLQSIAVVLVFMVIARPVTVLCSLLPDRRARWHLNEILFFCWTRETGVIAAALVGIVSSSYVPEVHVMTAVTFVAILMTLLIQGSTTPFVAKLLNLIDKDPSNPDDDGEYMVKVDDKI